MTAPNELAVQISVTRSFSEGSGVTWMTSVPQDTCLDDINDVNDKVMSAIERQELWARISMINNEIEMHTKQRAQVVFTMRALEERHGDFSKVNLDTRNAYNQSKEGLLRIDTLIEALKQEQARLRKGLQPGH